MKYEKCYLCENLGETIEHVPPKAIFPESKDIPWKDFRKNLITVPSCKLHNSGKSNDDQFLLVCLAGIIGGNEIGYIQKLTKVKRTLLRNSYSLMKQVLLGEIRTETINTNGASFELLIGKPNVARLNTCFDRISRALFYHQFRRKHSGKVVSHFGFVQNEIEGLSEFSRFLSEKAEIDLQDIEKLGENQEVFYYQFSKIDAFGFQMIKMCFYGKLNIFSSFVPEGFIGGNIVTELMFRGIPTTFQLPDKQITVDLSRTPLY